MISAAKPMPYIGITGITNRWQIETVLYRWLGDLFEWPANRLLMNGILVSSRSLSGGRPNNPRLYPRIKDVNGLMPADPVVFNVVHFNISGLGKRPELINGLYQYLEEIHTEIPAAEGIQLNLPWPDVSALRAFRDRSPVELIIQVSKQAYDQCGTPEALVERLRPYEGVVDRLLLDPSGGTGTAFDVELTKRQLGTLTESGLNIAMGLAGGISGSSIGSLRQVVSSFPDVSWDAQGQLRDQHDRLEIAKAYDFLKNSVELVLMLEKQRQRAGSK